MKITFTIYDHENRYVTENYTVDTGDYFGIIEDFRKVIELRELRHKIWLQGQKEKGYIKQ